MAAISSGPPDHMTRVVALCGSGVGTRYLLRSLRPAVDLQAVVWERSTRRHRWKLVLNRCRRLGLLYPIDRLLLSVYSRLRLRRRAAACAEWREMQSARDYRPECRQITVSSVNDSRVAELLDELAPDLVIVSGTGIIRAPVLRAAPPMVNIHTGITPLYRGAHGAVWAVIREDLKNVGVTVHQIDPGIDTGRILRQVYIPFDPPSDNLLTLQAKQAVAGARALVDWIRDHEPAFADAPEIAPPAGPSTLFFSPGLRDYRRFERIAARMRAAATDT